MSEIDKLIDKEMKALQQDMAEVYKQAKKDLQKDIDTYFRAFQKEDNAKKKELEDGEITKEEYKQWRVRTMCSGKEYRALEDKIAQRYLQANQETAELRNKKARAVYALSHNYAAYDLERSLNG